MLKAIKKVLISILIVYMCISPLAQNVLYINNVQATATPTPTPERIGITRERVYSYEESATTGFQYYIHVGNVTYTHYYQVRGDYKDRYISFWGKTIRQVGCGMTSCSILLSGYGVNLNPGQILDECSGSFGISSTLTRHGVSGRWYSGKTQTEYINIIQQALSEGKPAMVFVKPIATHFWTSYQHYMVVVGQDENYLWVCDPAHTDDAHQMYTQKVQGLVRDLVEVYIPENAPAGGNAGGTYVPSPGGGGGEVNPGTNIPVTWEIGNEIPDMDELGDFKYKGNPKTMTFNGSVKPLEWVFNLIKNFIDYILGMMFTVTKIAIVGTIENIENLINGTILKIEEIDEDIHYTIEDLVYNRIPLLDPNILSGTAGGKELKSGGTLEKIRNLIAGWYVSFRNISILLIFIMLIYTGLRMAISNSAQNKADFKSQLYTWGKCLAMAFVLHYVIFLVLNLNNTLVGIFDPSNNTVHENILYNTIKTRAYDLRLSIGFTGTVMYIILFFYWIRFLIIYIKRLLKIILLVVTSPFVIARYAMDNASGKGKKAYKDWLHEFVTNVFIQSIHALEYTVLIGIAVDLGTNSIIGFIIALVFLSQILKFDETILSILKFDGEDTGKRIKPLKEPLHISTYINYQYAKTAINLTGKAAKKVGSGVSTVGKFANSKIKEKTDVDILGAVSQKKDAVLNKKDDILKSTIGKLSEEKSALYDLRKTTREKDENGAETKRAKQAKKTLKKYKKDKKKRYKAQREQFVKQSRVLSSMIGVGKFTIGTALMTQNLTAGALMAGLSPKEIKEAIVEHDKRRAEYEKNNKKIDELKDTVKTVSKANQIEDSIQSEIEGLDSVQREKALRELLTLSSVNGNTALIDDAINDYMTRHDIKIINTDNIDQILNASFDTIDPSKKLSTQQREQLIRELKKNLKIKRENEWMSMEDAAKQAEARGLDERGRSTRKAPEEKPRETSSEDKTKEQTPKTEGRTIDDWSKERTLTPEERIKKAQETYETHYTRQEVANIFSQSIQTAVVSEENRGLAEKVTQIQDLNYRYMKQNKKKLKNANKFIQDIGNRYK